MKKRKDMIPLDQFIKELDKMPRKKFKPFAYHNVPGDMLEVFWSNENHYAQWVNKEITLLVSQKDKKTVVGVIVEGLSKVMKTRLPGLITLFASIDMKQHEAIRTLAFKERRSIGDITSAALDMYLKKKGKK